MVAGRQPGERACGGADGLTVFRDNLHGNTGLGGLRERDFQDAPRDGRQRRRLLSRFAIFRAGAGIKIRAAIASFRDRSALHRHSSTRQYLGQLENQPEDQGDGRFHVHDTGMSTADCHLFQMIFVDLDYRRPPGPLSLRRRSGQVLSQILATPQGVMNRTTPIRVLRRGAGAEVAAALSSQNPCGGFYGHPVWVGFRACARGQQAAPEGSISLLTRPAMSSASWVSPSSRRKLQ